MNMSPIDGKMLTRRWKCDEDCGIRCMHAPRHVIAGRYQLVLGGPFPAGALDSLLLLADPPGAGGVGRDRLLANACYTTLASCGRAFTAPADRAAAESARPWASCLCRPRRGTVFDCRTSTTGRGP